ncbi:hypothetical protein [Glycomyces terrestris]|uniref:Uncharacterized protein n=1 Tax=Glycomyces terrestris TaxID=2493553 RepID=A0A426UV56_9ACTN|nr:hypothetical protein [Glycomyces terrestris]RRR98236.1 hypothetical protein EIW28_15090 [Glycomyces terrestris]
MDFLGTNPNQAAAAAESTTALAASFRTLQADLLSTVERCRAAAGEPEVADGYDAFGSTWSVELAGIAAHGESVGGAATASVAEAAGTDGANASGFGGIDAPPVAPPAIRPY